jgi:hypothetical protein
LREKKDSETQDNYKDKDIVFILVERGMGTYFEIMKNWTMGDLADYYSYLLRTKK